MLFEHPNKVCRGVESNFFTCIPDTETLMQKTASLFHTIGNNVVSHGKAGAFFENLTQPGFADVKMLRYLFYRNIFCVIIVNVLQNIIDTFFAVCKWFQIAAVFAETSGQFQQKTFEINVELDIRPK